MDIRRTILLMIFSFSLLMLWNNWQILKHARAQTSAQVRQGERARKGPPGRGAVLSTSPRGGGLVVLGAQPVGRRRVTMLLMHHAPQGYAGS